MAAATIQISLEVGVYRPDGSTMAPSTCGETASRKLLLDRVSVRVFRADFEQGWRCLNLTPSLSLEHPESASQEQPNYSSNQIKSLMAQLMWCSTDQLG